MTRAWVEPQNAKMINVVIAELVDFPMVFKDFQMIIVFERCSLAVP